MNLTTRKELANLALADSANIRIARIIDKEVIPEGKAARFNDAQHLLRDALFHLRIENRTKNRGLQDDVERCVRKIQSRRAAALQAHAVRTELSRLFNPFRQQVNPKNILRERAPLQKCTKPITCTAADF